MGEYRWEENRWGYRGYRGGREGKEKGYSGNGGGVEKVYRKSTVEMGKEKRVQKGYSGKEKYTRYRVGNREGSREGNGVKWGGGERRE